MEGSKNQHAHEQDAIRYDNGLLIDARSNTVLGYLFNFSGHGVFSPDGKVQILPQEVEAHNKLLSRAEILGLDTACEIGQRGTLYYQNDAVTTWMGEEVSKAVRVNGQVITFRRNGKTFRGRLQKDATCFNFKRMG